MKLFGLFFGPVAFAQIEVLEDNNFNTARWGKQMSGPMCFKCEGNSWKECREQAWEREGGPVSCREDKVCSMVERRRGGKIYRVESRCKQVDVCLMERWHNLRPCPQMPSATECNRMERDRLLTLFLLIFIFFLFRKRCGNNFCLSKLLRSS